MSPVALSHCSYRVKNLARVGFASSCMRILRLIFSVHAASKISICLNKPSFKWSRIITNISSLVHVITFLSDLTMKAYTNDGLRFVYYFNIIRNTQFFCTKN